ncbi:hypothetical protein LGQ02_09930 [Bacillus shivajii]|uniref:hypothetical protein n=1 Tax=Bacillus shivajii TaxID=1983719 RepID=UPI001CF94208|nr:hypothetical protein [Bacillus shivajii]UCZ55011.1 hypothetical protein LGQ02_09930 [Bacillus shivajii]
MNWKVYMTVVFFFLSGLVLVGCGQSNDDKALLVQSELLMTEKTFPNNFYDISEQGVMVRKVTDQDDFKSEWGEFGLSDQPLELDWKNNVAIFLGTGESGTCPLEFQFVEINDDKTKMIIHLEQSNGACTSDFTPRTFILSVDTEEISNVTHVEVKHGDGSRASKTLQ